MVCFIFKSLLPYLWANPNPLFSPSFKTSRQRGRGLLLQTASPGRVGCERELASAPGARGRGPALHFGRGHHETKRTEVQSHQATYAPLGLQDLGSQRPVPAKASLRHQREEPHGRSYGERPTDHAESALFTHTAIFHH